MINDFYNDNQISGQTRKKLTSDMFNGPQGIFQEGCVGSAWGEVPFPYITQNVLL